MRSLGVSKGVFSTVENTPFIMFSSPVAVLRLDARDTLGVLLAVEDTGVVEDLQALETALAAVDTGGVDAQGVC